MRADERAIGRPIAQIFHREAVTVMSDRLAAQPHLTVVSAQPPASSDEALALRFAALHEKDLRYIDDRHKWFVWDGRRWRRDATLRAYDFVRATCREASSKREHSAESKAIASAHTVTAVERPARADQRLAATTDQWDRDAWLLNTPGGTIDLRTGRLRNPCREDYCTRITPVTPAAGCPRWLSFLNRIMAGNEENIRYLSRVSGYALTGETKEHALFFLHGEGSNGKSVLVGALMEAMGDYAQTSPVETFMAAGKDRHLTELADLDGARLVVANEADSDRYWNESRLKLLTGGDRIKARYMREDLFEFKPQCKIVIVGNHKPSFRAVNYAIRRRLNLIEFKVTIPPDEVDKSLAEKLREELPGILQWMIDGCLEWQRDGLSPPLSVCASTENYLNQEDTFKHWLDARSEKSANTFTPTAELFASWEKFAKSAAEEPGNEKRFVQEMGGRGFEAKRTNSSRGFLGIALRKDVTE